MRLLVLHVADIHLGKNRKYTDYLDQQGAMLRAIVAQAREALAAESSDYVVLVVAGDVFDKNQGTLRAELVLFLNHFVKPVTELLRKHDNFSVVAIDGNHDRQPSAEDPSVLSPLVGMLHPRFHLTVVAPAVIELPFARFLSIPYGGYSTSEFTKIITSTPGLDFVVAHECLARMRTDLGFSMPREQDKYIEINDVLAAGEAPASIFLGDIHRCQTLDDNQVSWYSGSPTTLDFGHALPKGVLHHTFVRESERWSRESLPELKPLQDPSIRVHRRLGLIKTVAEIPWDLCYQHESTYIDLVLTPEVFKEISEKIPSFFNPARVSFEHEKDVTSTKEAAKEQESSLSIDINVVNDDYYNKAVAEYASINLNHLDVDLRLAFVSRVLKMFATR